MLTNIRYECKGCFSSIGHSETLVELQIRIGPIYRLLCVHYISWIKVLQNVHSTPMKHIQIGKYFVRHDEIITICFSLGGCLDLYIKQGNNGCHNDHKL